jgi:hypothetical protein
MAVFNFSAIFDGEEKGMDKNEGCSIISPDKHFGHLLLLSLLS